MKIKHIIFSLFIIGAVSCASHKEGGEEHGSKEGKGEHESGGREGGESNEEDPNEFGLDYNYDQTKYGARLILSYNKSSNSFKGSVENTSNETLDRVRVEVHLSNGTELGPTTPTSLVAGQKMEIDLKATEKAFEGWTAHAEVGNMEHGSEGESGDSQEGGEGREGGEEHGREGGESGEGREGGEEHSRKGGERGEGREGGEGGDGEGHGTEGREANEAAMSSPITALNKSWKGTLGGLDISMQYDAETKTLFGTVKNTTSETLCFVQSEPHLKMGERTVGEMGPEKLGDLKPGQVVNSRLSIKDEPDLANVKFDGYVIHMEIYNCDGSGPKPHNEGGE